MDQDDNPDGLKILRELIEVEKAEAYQKFHGDDFPGRWGRRQSGESARRPRLKPLAVMLAGVLPVLFAIIIGWGLFLEEKGRLAEPFLGNVSLQTRLPERTAVLRRKAGGLEPLKESLEKFLRDGYRKKSFPDAAASSVAKALQACLMIWNHGQTSPAPAPEMVQKERIRSRLFAEIMTKWKEV